MGLRLVDRHFDYFTANSGTIRNLSIGTYHVEKLGSEADPVRETHVETAHNKRTNTDELLVNQQFTGPTVQTVADLPNNVPAGTRFFVVSEQRYYTSDGQGGGSGGNFSVQSGTTETIPTGQSKNVNGPARVGGHLRDEGNLEVN